MDVRGVVPKKCPYAAHDGCHHTSMERQPSYWKRLRVCDICPSSCILLQREKITKGCIELFDRRFPHSKIRDLPARTLRDYVFLEHGDIGSKGIQKVLFLLMHLNHVTRANYPYSTGRKGVYSRDLAGELRADIKLGLIQRGDNAVRLDPAGRPIRKHFHSLSRERWNEIKKLIHSLPSEECEFLEALIYIYYNMTSEERAELSEEVYCSLFAKNTRLDDFRSDNSDSNMPDNLTASSYQNLKAMGNITISTAVSSPISIAVDAYQIVVDSTRREVAAILEQMPKIDNIKNKADIESLSREIINEDRPKLNWLREKVEKLIPLVSQLTAFAMNLHALKRLVGIE